MTTSPRQPLAIFGATPPELRDFAIELVLRARGSEATSAIQAAISDQTDALGKVDGLLVAARGEQIVAALALRFQPGRTAQLWAPRLIAGESSELAMAIIKEAVRLAAGRDCSLVQALPESEYPGDLPLLEAAGFGHVADLFYMVSPLGQLWEEPPALDLELIPLTRTDQSGLAAMIDRTYVGTQDCPALNGVRSVEDVLDGYRAIGRHDPANWFLLRRGGADIGCLVLADHNNSGQWELVYLGLAPEARGEGLALPLVRQAQWLAHAAGARQLVLAVDAQNAPAVRAYLAAGFVVWDRRPIYLRILTGPTSRA